MPAEINFDDLSARADAAGSTIDDKNRLFGQVFSLTEWYFIARGEFPDVRPYVASNPAVADGQYMIRAFTDGERLYRFAEENDLRGENREGLILSVPVKGIIG